MFNSQDKMGVDIRGGVYQDSNVAKFLDSTSVEYRQNMVRQISQERPNVVPIILVRANGVDFDLPKFKFLISSSNIFSTFVIDVRKQITNLNPSDTLFFFINGVMPVYHATMGQLYDKYANEDGFMYVMCVKENTFGQIA